MTLWYGITSVLLGVLLFFPVRKFMLVLRVNRFQGKNKRELTAEEMVVLKKKVSVTAALIAVTFAFLYNKVLIFKFFSGGIR